MFGCLIKMGISYSPTFISNLSYRSLMIISFYMPPKDSVIDTWLMALGVA